jgi:hypothetical protein
MRVPRVRDWLDRFRPAGGPGAPSAAGVPTDRRAVAAAELAPVFAALVDAVHNADAGRHRAAEEARRLVSAAQVRASAIVEQARLDWEAVRATEEARIRSEATEGPEPTAPTAGWTSAEVADRVVAQVRLDVATLATARRRWEDR